MASVWKGIADAFTPVFRPAGNVIDGVEPGSWASPQNPIRPTIQLGVGIRQWDFTPGINLQFTPRGDVPVKFAQLWNVSNSFDLCRLMIETRKDQIVNRPWVIRAKPKPGETKKELAQRQANMPDVAAVTKVFQKPDGVHTFDLWIRMWIEELIVFDAPTIAPVRNMLGDVFQFRLISGATITPLLDQQGFRPFPPSPAYQQIILGIPTSNLLASAEKDKNAKKFSADELIYSPRNPRVNSRWGFPPVEQIVVTLSIAANRQQFFRDYYTSGNVPEGLLPMPEGWTSTQIKDFQKWFDSMLAGNLGMKRRMIMIPDAKREPTMTKSEALTDVTDDYLIRVVAFAFSITPQNLIKQVNRGTAKESSDVAQIEGLEPYLKHIENVMNEEIIVKHLQKPDLEFAYLDEREMDPEKQSKVDDLYLRNATYTINEIREARGDDPLDFPEANEPGIYTPTGWMPLKADSAVTRQAALAPPEPEPDPEPNGPGGAKKPAKAYKSLKLECVAGDLTPRSRQARNDAKRRLAKFLSDQKQRVAKGARQAYAARKVRKGDTETDTDRALAILAAIEFDYPSLYSILQPYLEIAAEEGVKAGAYQVTALAGADLNATIESAMGKAKADASDRAAELVGLELKDDGTLAEATSPRWAMSTTAKDDVLATIKQAIKENWTPAQLEAVIEAATIWTPDHAEMVADNEIVRQQASGHIASWLHSGKVLEYAWIVQPNCCPLCESFAQIGSVPVGYQFAPMIYAPAAHPFCRCSLRATKFAEEE